MKNNYEAIHPISESELAEFKKMLSDVFSDIPMDKLPFDEQLILLEILKADQEESLNPEPEPKHTFGGRVKVLKPKDYNLLLKMSDWMSWLKTYPPAPSKKMRYVVVDGLWLWAFFPYRDGWQILSGSSLEDCSAWVIESMQTAINWCFSNTGVEAVYSGASDFTEIEKHIIEEVGMEYSHEEQKDGVVVRFYKIKRLSNIDVINYPELLNKL